MRGQETSRVMEQGTASVKIQDTARVRGRTQQELWPGYSKSEEYDTARVGGQDTARVRGMTYQE